MILEGNCHFDDRGKIRFINNLDLSRAVRMYAIEPKKGVVRAWQGHRKETKWFFIAKGHFKIKVINILTNRRDEYDLSADKSAVLEIPGGHYNGFQALDDESVLIVLSDFTHEESLHDDMRKSLGELPWEENQVLIQ